MWVQAVYYISPHEAVLLIRRRMVSPILQSYPDHPQTQDLAVFSDGDMPKSLSLACLHHSREIFPRAVSLSANHSSCMCPIAGILVRWGRFCGGGAEKPRRGPIIASPADCLSRLRGKSAFPILKSEGNFPPISCPFGSWHPPARREADSQHDSSSTSFIRAKSIRYRPVQQLQISRFMYLIPPSE